MKQLITILILLCPAFVTAQKLKYDPDFWQTRYYIGEQETTKNGMIDYTKTRNNDAFKILNKAKKQGTQAWIWAAVGVAGSVLVLTQAVKEDKNPTVYGAGLGIGAAGLGMSLIIGTVSGENYKKGVQVFNK